MAKAKKATATPDGYALAAAMTEMRPRHKIDGRRVTETSAAPSQAAGLDGHVAVHRCVTAGDPCPSRLVLSIFPGIGLLDRAFEKWFCVVRGPDLLWGGDVRRFSPPSNVFHGVIGGPPCQDFSAARRDPPTGYGREMLVEFVRIVDAAKPEWWLLENVARVPNVTPRGYATQRFELDQSWFEHVSRLRHFQYGWRIREDLCFHAWIDPPKGLPLPDCVPAALACDGRPWPVVRSLQGLPDDFDLPPFTTAAKVAAAGNGVPYCLASCVASLIATTWSHTGAAGQSQIPAAAGHTGAAGGVTVAPPGQSLRCRCGCGRLTRGRASYAGVTCRKRAQRARAKAAAE